MLPDMYPEAQSILSLCLLVLVVSLDSIDATCKTCPQGWTYYNHSCYTMFFNTEQRLQWFDAYMRCESLGAHLLMLDSREEARFVGGKLIEALPGDAGKNRKIWQGCKKTNGKRQCVDDYQEQLAALNASLRTCPAVVPLDINPLQTHLIDCSVRRRFVCENLLESNLAPSSCRAATNEDIGLNTPNCQLGHAYRYTPIKNPIICCMLCSKDPNCRSFNLSGKMCQLNNATISQADGRQIVATGKSCVYYTVN